MNTDLIGSPNSGQIICLLGQQQALSLDRAFSLVARTHQLVAETTAGYEQYMTVTVLRAFESFVNDLSNWYVRLSRRRFAFMRRFAVDHLADQRVA